MNKTIINPILPGFYPDPTACCVDGVYYVVNSSFVYFPGLPVFKSTDLCNWEQIGNVIDRPEQMTFLNQSTSRGLFAPCIRYNNGTFYCICTNVDEGGNFFVTAKDPAGPWTKPVFMPKAGGIDPSFFFDDDGTCWYVGTHPAPEGCKYNGNWEIYIQKVNLENGDLEGEAKGIWRGALKDCIWPEGPHIYKINGWYYLLHAEGGTGPEHAVMVARTKSLDEPFVGKPANPILTHRHLGMGADIVYVGHADLFEDKNGKWWLVLLASRPYSNDGNRPRYCNMGRETFMVPVMWEDDWPWASWKTGLVEKEYDTDGNVLRRYDAKLEKKLPARKNVFTKPELDYEWISLRNRNPEKVFVKDNALVLKGAEDLGSLKEASFVARRQIDFSYDAETIMDAELPNDGNAAGLSCFQNEDFFYNLQIANKGGKLVVQVLLREKGEYKVLVEKALPVVSTSSITELPSPTEVAGFTLSVSQNLQKLSFYCNGELLLADADASMLSVEKAGGFVGTVIGMFAAGEGAEARFKSFEM